MAKINLHIKKNKGFDSFWAKVYCPLTKQSIKITLGKKTSEFTEVEALQLLNYLKENISKYKKYSNNRVNCDYKKLINEYYNKDTSIKSEFNYSLNEVADKYFNSIEARIKKDFIETYKERFNLQSDEDVINNQIFKDKIRHARSAIRSYNKHYRVKEYLYEQQYSERTGKPKKNLTKVGVKHYWDIPQKPINEITKHEIKEMWDRIQNLYDIGQKTKYSLITMLKTIFNYAKSEGYIVHSVCDDINKKELTKNPHNYRQRILNVKEYHELMSCLYQRENKNAFNAAVLASSTGCRAKTTLSVMKKDFKIDYDTGFKDYYSTVELINVKLNRYYTLPLPIEIGRYFYYLLKEYEDDEYLIRHNNPNLRKKQPFSEIPKDFFECCSRTVNATGLMKKIYGFIDADKEKLRLLEQNKMIVGMEATHKAIVSKKASIKKNEEIIQKERDKTPKGSKEYLENNFSFHNLRHMVVSLTSVFNPLYASRILDHKKNGITDKYIKAEIDAMREILTKGLNDFIIDFIKPKIETLQKELQTNFSIEKERYESKLRMDNASLDLEAHRENYFEDFQNEEAVMKILAMDMLADYKKQELIENLKTYDIPDDSYEYILELLEMDDEDIEKYERINEVILDN